MTHAQTHINTQFNNETTEIEVKQVFINEVVNGRTIIADKLTGELEIKDYPVLTKIRLIGHEIEKLTIINCPNLKEIRCHTNKLTELDITRIKTDDDGNPVPTEKLKSLYIGGNKELKKVSLEYCPELEFFFAPGDKKLDRVLGLSKLSKLRNINMDGLPRNFVDLILEEKGLFSLSHEQKSEIISYEQEINALQEKKVFKLI